MNEALNMPKWANGPTIDGTRHSDRTVPVICAWCRSAFERRLVLVRRSIADAKEMYCSKSCVTSGRHHGTTYRGRDEKVMRRHLVEIKSRAKSKGISYALTYEDLLTAYRKQGGQCAISGEPLELVTRMNYTDIAQHPNRASIDRIDPARGYTPENIQWTCTIGNLAKGYYSTQQIIEWALAVAAHQASA